LNVFTKFFICDPEHIIDGNDAQQNIIVIGNGKGYPIIHFKNFIGFFLVIIYIECNKPAIHQLTHFFVGRCKDDVPDSNII
jgi:hypothetical protein